MDDKNCVVCGEKATHIVYDDGRALAMCDEDTEQAEIAGCNADPIDDELTVVP